MNKLFIILLTVLTILCVISCTRVDDAMGDPSKETDTSAVTDKSDESVTLQENTEAGDAVVTDNVLDPDGFEEDETIGNTGTATAKPEQSDNNASVEDGTTAPDTEFLGVDHSKFSYEDYINMTPQQQTSFIKSFSSLGEFTDWYNDAKSEYDENNDRIDIGDGTIDLGDIFNN